MTKKLSAKAVAKRMDWPEATQIAERWLGHPLTEHDPNWERKIMVASNNFLSTPRYQPLKDMFQGLADGDDPKAKAAFETYLAAPMAWSQR